jgi:uncharacterized repeat protein (TIGR02543 family)
MPPNDVTYYPYATLNDYTISFNSQGGDTTPASQTKQYGTKVSNPGAVTKTGHTFRFWSTSSTGTTEYNWDNTAITANFTLYAIWQINQYTLSFDGNGATSGSQSSYNINYGDTLPSSLTPGFSRTGYTFWRYCATTTGGTVYYWEDGSLADSRHTMPANDLITYAI